MQTIQNSIYQSKMLYNPRVLEKKTHEFFLSLSSSSSLPLDALPLLLLAHVRTHRVVQGRRHDEAIAARCRARAVLKPIARWALNIYRCAVWSTMVGYVALSAERF